MQKFINLKGGFDGARVVTSKTVAEFEAAPYAAPSPRHSARAAVRLASNFSMQLWTLMNEIITDGRVNADKYLQALFCRKRNKGCCQTNANASQFATKYRNLGGT